MAVKDMKTDKLVDTLVWLENERKEVSKKSNAYKAELQARGLAAIEDKNVRYVRFEGKEGCCSVADTQSLEILNPMALRDALPQGLWETVMSVEMKPVYKAPAKMEKALKAIFSGDYTFEHTLPEFLSIMSVKPDTAQTKLLTKKLKGDYEKDRELLESVFPEQNTDWDVELWYINKIKNAELIQTYLGDGVSEDRLDAIRKNILVESKTSIRIDAYDVETEN